MHIRITFSSSYYKYIYSRESLEISLEEIFFPNMITNLNITFKEEQNNMNIKMK